MRYVGGVVLGIALVLMVVSLVVGDSTTARAARLANFTRRQGVTITPENTAYVLNALGQSRFWRRFGLTVTFFSGVGVAMPFGSSRAEEQPKATWLVVFGGWFLGLIVAEWRAAGTRTAPDHRRASLTRRTARDYVTRYAVSLLLGFGLVTLGTGGWLAARARVEPTVREPFLWVAAVAAIAAVLIWITVRRILTRPQAVGEQSLMVADDGLRARSLQLLAGGSIAAISWVGAAFLALVGRTFDPYAAGDAFWANAGGWGVFLAFAGTVAGVIAGTQPTARSRVGGLVATRCLPGRRA